MKYTKIIKGHLLSILLLTGILHSGNSFGYLIYDTGAFVNSSSLGTSSLGHLNGVFNDFAGSGIDFDFSMDLDSSGLGEISWLFTNNTGATLSDVTLFGYLDGEIDPDLNSSFNEYGQYVSVDGVGAGDINPDSWEIDEPGFVFGDIYDNLFLGALDNVNAVGLGYEDDVSMALGFQLGDILNGEAWELILNISDFDIGGLYHGDNDSGTGVYFNGTATVDRLPPVSVDEPAPILLFMTGVFAVVLARKRTV